MKISVERNRARSFRAALETLREATQSIIEQMEFDLSIDTVKGDAEIEKRRDELGDTDDAIIVFDDALEQAAIERNAYIVQLELALGEMTVKVKEISG